VLIGMKLSVVGAATPNALRLGDPLLFKLLQWLVVKPPLGRSLFAPYRLCGLGGSLRNSTKSYACWSVDGGTSFMPVFGEKSGGLWSFIAVLAVLHFFTTLAGWF